MTRVPTLAAHNLMASRLMQTQTNIYDLQTQLSTKKKSQDYTGIAADTSRLINFETQASRTQAFITTNTVANTKLSTMSTSVTGARKSLIQFRDDLSKFLGRDLTSMDDAEINDFKDLQQRAFNIMKDVEDYFDIKIDGQYLFAGGKSDAVPVSVPYTSLEAFQSVYDGNTVTAPESRFAHMNNTQVTAAETGTLTFNAGGTIVAGNAEAFNLQHYNSAGMGSTTFDSTAGTISATNANVFGNVEAGMTIQVGGSTGNDRFYTVTGISSDGRTLTVVPPPAADETAPAGLDVTVPSVQPGPMTVTGSNGNNRTYTVTGVSIDGTTLTVTPPPSAEALGATRSAQISNAIYYQGGETVVQHRVDETRSVEFGVNAKDGAVEKALRAIGMVCQGMPVDGSGEVDGEELRRRLDSAFNIASDAVDHSNLNNATENGQDFGRLENLLASNQVVLKNALDRQKTQLSFFQTRAGEIENADPTEVAVKINDESNALQYSYAAMSMVNRLSLLSYLG
ncbi:conserved hypothetical protein [uncultured Alphaproteobacteria bacterium]|uniref:Uncharacterized protein n=1 Tax=uncultured Alphaproteobacteria bacterium TaxID=91750 RepID=A0A212JPL2_9PROT|nr:conserved hypothetical protein [uncultured Alphaproteobacteria bacterium]